MVCTQQVVLALLAPILASGNPCETGASYAPTDTFEDTDENGQTITRTCEDGAGWTTGFVASKEKCEEPFPAATQYTYAQVIADIGRKCCGGTADACSQFGFNYCTGEINRAAQVNADETTTCGQYASYIGTFDATQASCNAMLTLGDETHARSMYLAYIAPNCCAGGTHICSQHLKTYNPCRVESDFQPDTSINDEMTCQKGVDQVFMGEAEINEASCAEQIESNGAMTSRKTIVDEAPQCCGNKATKCDVAEGDYDDSTNKSTTPEGGNKTSDSASDKACSVGAPAVLLTALAAATAC